MNGPQELPGIGSGTGSTEPDRTPPQLDAQEFAELFGKLRAWVTHVYPSLAPNADDLVADSIAQVFERIHLGEQPTNLNAYLYAAVRNTALSSLRRHNRVVFGEIDAVATSPGSDGPEFDELVERLVSEGQVEEAFEAARRWRSSAGTGDATAIKVLSAFLDQAVERTPTVRQVAEASGVTHVTVMRVYLQVRAYLTDPGGGWVPRSRLRPKR